jgi:hypothetical protein
VTTFLGDEKRNVISPLYQALVSGSNSPVSQFAEQAYLPTLKSLFSAEGGLWNPLQKDYLSKMVTPNNTVDSMDEETGKLIQNLKIKGNFENIISKDETLLSIYETAMNLAPNVMLNKEIARSILRAANVYGQGGLDAETAKLLAQLETEARKARLPDAQLLKLKAYGG